jgi:membrane-bound serine protease (ClpP class)
MILLGIALLVAGTALVVAEAHLPSFGALGVTGSILAIVGAIVAMEGAGAGLALALVVALIVGLAAAALVGVVVKASVKASRPRAVTGAEGIVGHVGVLRSAPEPVGLVFVDGALWRARPCLEDDLRAGEHVVVEGVKGLVLSVRRAEEWELEP